MIPAAIGAEARDRNRRDWIFVPAALLLLALLFLQGILFIAESSQTNDEPTHLAAGFASLSAGDFRLNPEHPPLIKELAALPLLPLGLNPPAAPAPGGPEQMEIGRDFVHRNRLSNDAILLAGRLPILLLSLALGWSIFLWSRTLFGPAGALLSLALYVFDPNVVAHSGLVTTDIGVTLFMFLSMAALCRWSRAPSPPALAATGLALGCAFASKFTALWILPLLGALALVLLDSGVALPERPWRARSSLVGPGAPMGRRIVALGLAGLFMALVGLVTVAATYGGGHLPVWMEGLRIALGHAERGHPAYLMGATSSHGWWSYFLVAYLVKTPIGTLIVIVLSLAAIALGARARFVEEAFLWIPIAGLTLITSLIPIDIGLRHFLPIYPFLYVSAGRVAASLAPGPGSTGAPGTWLFRPSVGARRMLTLVLAACLGSIALDAFRISPYNLAFFNAIAGGPERGDRFLIDSNLDWGQSSKALRRFEASRHLDAIYCAYAGTADPGYYGVRYQYVPGAWNLESDTNRPDRVPEGSPELLAVGATVLHDLHAPPSHPLFSWLLERTPVAAPGYSYRVYDITGDAESHARLAWIYLEDDRPTQAAEEARKALRIDPSHALARRALLRAGAAGNPSDRP